MLDDIPTPVPQKPRKTPQLPTLVENYKTRDVSYIILSDVYVLMLRTNNTVTCVTRCNGVTFCKELSKTLYVCKCFKLIFHTFHILLTADM